MKKNRGFTLMELLIVIAIIGILVSVSVVSYSSAQKKGRDARRHTDLKAMQNAWEQYYADNNANYPATCGYSTTPTPGVMSGTYLPGGMPFDPKSGATPTPYLSINAGWSSCSATSYCFCAGLEGEANSKTDCTGNVAPTGYIGLDCVRSLQ
ncbi:MAG: type II secretion system protein [Candidatus Gottesmanbacteria bacterium]|nr:type II secretion system protein [Candidatus Gottesmanbacteria bacterium]